jgi:hypothetical protein
MRIIDTSPVRNMTIINELNIENQWICVASMWINIRRHGSLPKPLSATKKSSFATRNIFMKTNKQTHRNKYV